jgi:hypothetical protein
MKNGISRAVRLAICTLSALAEAGWNTNAWPSTNHWRFGYTNLALYPAVSNLYAWQVVNVYTQSSSTNVIPAIDCLDDFDVCGDNQVHGPFPAASTNLIAYTQRFYRTIREDAPDEVLALWPGNADNVDVFEWTTTNALGVVTNQVATEWWNAETNAVITGRLEVVDQWCRDAYRMARERWWALNPTDAGTNAEDYIRNNVGGDSGLWAVLGHADYYRSARSNLVNTKRLIAGLLGERYRSGYGWRSFVDLRHMDGSNTLNGYFSTNLAWEWAARYPATNSCEAVTNWARTSFDVAPPAVSITSLVACIPGFPFEVSVQTLTVGAAGVSTPYGYEVGLTNLYQPTNGTIFVRTNYARTWFDWTPRRNLGGNAGPGQGRVATSQWELASFPAAGGEFTNRLVSSGACDSNSYFIVRAATTNAAGAITQSVVSLYRWEAGWTQQIASAAYTNDTMTTNTAVLTNWCIADGFAEADYGFRHVPAIASNLVAIAVRHHDTFHDGVYYTGEVLRAFCTGMTESVTETYDLEWQDLTGIGCSPASGSFTNTSGAATGCLAIADAGYGAVSNFASGFRETNIYFSLRVVTQDESIVYAGEDLDVSRFYDAGTYNRDRSYSAFRLDAYSLSGVVFAVVASNLGCTAQMYLRNRWNQGLVNGTEAQTIGLDGGTCYTLASEILTNTDCGYTPPVALSIRDASGPAATASVVNLYGLPAAGCPTNGLPDGDYAAAWSNRLRRGFHAVASVPFDGTSGLVRISAAYQSPTNWTSADAVESAEASALLSASSTDTNCMDSADYDRTLQWSKLEQGVNWTPILFLLLDYRATNGFSYR